MLTSAPLPFDDATAFDRPHASNATATRAEAARRFDEGAQRFFTATINTVRKLRPNVKLGTYIRDYTCECECECDYAFC